METRLEDDIFHIGFRFTGRRKMRDGSILQAPAALMQGGEASVLSRTFLDGECWSVEARLLGQGSILRSKTVEAWGWEEEWMYDKLDDAVLHLIIFDRGRSAEPDGWLRHTPSMRRREDGDPKKETIRP